MKKKIIGIFVCMLMFVTVFSVTGATNINDMAKTANPASPLFEGESYFILLSSYADGMGQDNKWAVQLRFDSALDVVEYEHIGEQLPLIYNEWTEIRVEINLDTDWHEVFYGGEFLYEQDWTAGPNQEGDGELSVDAVDLFANGASSVYYDDMSLEKVGVGTIWSDNFDSYDDGSSMHGQGGWKGWDNDPTWTAYVTSQESQSAPHSVGIAGDADLVHEYTDATEGEFIYTAWIYIPSIAPALSCAGSLSWTDVSQGETVTGSFTVSNIGSPGSMLNWEIQSHPDWGTWTFTPESGTDLTPESSPITVEVEVAAPSEENEFAGEIKIINSDNPGEYCTIDVSMAVPVNQPTLFQDLFENLFERFPGAFRILRQLLGL